MTFTIELHRQVILTSGALNGIRDAGALDSAVAQHQMTFGGEDCYPTSPEKASAPAFFLIGSRSFVD